MFRKLTLLFAGALLAMAMPLAAQAKTFYWISHGSPADPVWTYFLAGAKQWAKDTGNTVNTSFHNGDVPSQQEAVRAAIAAKADGIVTTSPDPGSLVEVAKEANAANIPIINFNTPDPKASFDAYVGGDNVVFGRHWAQYLVDKGLVKSGDFVWMPVEVPGATYGVQEEEGIASVFKPLGITWEVTDATLDQAEIITRMTDYLTANRGKVKAIIGLGDLVTGCDQARLRPGRRQAGRDPGGRLGQLARHHPGSAATATSTPASGRTRRRPATSRCRSPTWRRAASRRDSTSSPARSTRRTPRRLRQDPRRQVSLATSGLRGRLDRRPRSPASAR